MSYQPREGSLPARLCTLARHGQGKSSGVLLVPGVPEAEAEDEKGKALRAWIGWCAMRNGAPLFHGVVFHGRAEEVTHV